MLNNSQQATALGIKFKIPVGWAQRPTSDAGIAVFGPLGNDMATAANRCTIMLVTRSLVDIMKNARSRPREFGKELIRILENPKASGEITALVSGRVGRGQLIGVEYTFSNAGSQDFNMNVAFIRDFQLNNSVLVHCQGFAFSSKKPVNYYRSAGAMIADSLSF